MKLQITIDGKHYEAEVEVVNEPIVPHRAPQRAATAGTAGAPRTPASADADASAPSSSNDGSGEHTICTSAVMGLVVKVLTKVGQEVRAGDSLLVLEAMKMESNVNAPVAGTVAKILVAPGDSVKKGQALVEIA